MNAKENLLRAIRHDAPEWVPNGLEESVWLASPVVERPAQAGRDDWGVLHDLEVKAEGGTYPAHNGHTITDLSRWREQMHAPDIDAMDWSQVEAQAKAIDRGRHLVVGFVDYGLFERSYLLLGMDNALIAYLTEPETMGEIVATIADYKIRVIERFDDAADLEMIWYGDDWGTQDNLFLPPEVWRAVIRPHTQRVYDCMKQRGILINQHSCGRIDAVFADMVEMGADVFNPCQPCNNLAGMKQRHKGQIAFCGGIDSQHVLGRPGVTPDEVRAEVRLRIDEMAQGGGYIAAPSHDVPYDPALLEAMRDEIATYGKEAYRHDG